MEVTGMIREISMKARAGIFFLEYLLYIEQDFLMLECAY